MVSKKCYNNLSTRNSSTYQTLLVGTEGIKEVYTRTNTHARTPKLDTMLPCTAVGLWFFLRLSYLFFLLLYFYTLLINITLFLLIDKVQCGADYCNTGYRFNSFTIAQCIVN